MTKQKPLNLEDIWWANTPFGDFTKVVSLQSIKSACEFWLRYCQKPELLQKEYPKIYAKWINYFVERVKLPDEERKSYMEWLFKLAFMNNDGGEKFEQL